MIVDLNLQEKSVIVIGGGNEAQKRINSLMNQECNITVISDKVTPQITKLAKLKKIQLKKQKIQDTKFISEFKPDIIITTTNDKKLNQNIINAGKKKKKKLKKKSERVFKKIITKEDISQIKIQKIARDATKEKIATPAERKACLSSIMADNEIDQLIKDGQMKKAEKRAITIVRNWK
ncbi:Siroheme synthase protein [Marine Group I thaumarchaeote SCGC AAA799-D11]|uniref:precorrin-2 dehydrogenase n=1 Tax=Marine Group I thaumarchaeote SCGC AAA799-D11 TaxID=1502291 RepID=A0A087RTV1_9ARCH|nr:Siroheme synthase protein [Marine Group I thaumarchaeote SCGC AAA799-D11]